MHNVKNALLLLSLVFTVPVMADSGHNHDHSAEKSHEKGHNDAHEDGHGHAHGAISDEKAILNATSKIKQLVKAGKINASWLSIKASSAKQKTFSGKTEWVITFKNSTIDDVAKQTLYLYLSLDGDYVAANYSGK